MVRRSRSQHRSRWRVRVTTLRPFVLLCVLATLWAGMDPALVEPIGPLATEPERIDQRFTRCERGSSRACVVDGDTFRLGRRRIRIIGIDAPERHGQCAEEVRRAEAASDRLQQLLNQGPFEMVGRIDDMTDRYGRELRTVRRATADGHLLSIAQQLRDEGHARRYLGGFRPGWC